MLIFPDSMEELMVEFPDDIETLMVKFPDGVEARDTVEAFPLALKVGEG